MANYSLPYFGDLDPKDLEEYYEVEIDFEGQELQIDLNFEDDSIDVKRLDVVKKFMENIPNWDKKNKQYIEEDYASEEGDTVREYIEHHLEEIGKEELSKSMDLGGPEEDTHKQLIKSLRLVRVGLYPDKEGDFAVFDYSIGPELTQYLVVINTDENGNLDYMTLES